MIEGVWEFRKWRDTVGDGRNRWYISGRVAIGRFGKRIWSVREDRETYGETETFTAARSRFFRRIRGEPTESPVPMSRQPEVQQEVAARQKMADVGAESMDNRNENEDDLSSRLKSYAGDADRGFGVYAIYLRGGVR